MLLISRKQKLELELHLVTTKPLFFLLYYRVVLDFRNLEDLSSNSASSIY